MQSDITKLRIFFVFGCVSCCVGGYLLISFFRPWWIGVGPTEPLAPVMFANEKMGYITPRGVVAIGPQWDYANGFTRSGLALVQLKSDVGPPICNVIDRSGKLISDRWWGRVYVPDRQGEPIGVALKWNEQAGLVDVSGKELVPPIWRFHEDDWITGPVDQNGLIRVQSEAGKWGKINTKGEIQVPIIYDAIGRGSKHQLIPAKLNDKWGYVDTHGKTKIEFQFDGAGEFDDFGMGLVKRNNKFGWINTSGWVVIPVIWSDASPFTERDVAVVQLDKLYGCINRDGLVVAPLRWMNLASFRWNSPSPAEDSDGLFGFVDTGGKAVIEPFWCDAREFEDCGLAPVKVGYRFGAGKWGLVDLDGKQVVAAEWDDLRCYFRAGKFGFAAEKDHLQGFINAKGKLTIPPVWRSREIYPDAGMIVCSDGPGLLSVFPFLNQWIEAYAWLGNEKSVAFNAEGNVIFRASSYELHWLRLLFGVAILLMGIVLIRKASASSQSSSRVGPSATPVDP